MYILTSLYSRIKIIEVGSMDSPAVENQTSFYITKESLRIEIIKLSKSQKSSCA
jgi:hypothetical protein